jgi:peptidoglycan hydrolase-like protein with peptidoglycan-binding domain
MMRRLVLAVAIATAAVALVPSPAQARTLSSGACGPDVFALQVRLYKRTYLPNGYRPGCFDYRTEMAVLAFQGWVGFPRTGVMGSLDMRRLVLSRTPVPWTKDKKYRHIEVHKGRSVMIVVGSNGVVQRVIHVSTGDSSHTTPSGRFQVYSKSRMSWSHLFHVWLPYAMYVVGGIAIHGYSSVPAYPASHGCIRTPMPEAPGLYAWAPVGTPVWIGD